MALKDLFKKKETSSSGVTDADLAALGKKKEEPKATTTTTTFKKPETAAKPAATTTTAAKASINDTLQAAKAASEAAKAAAAATAAAEAKKIEDVAKEVIQGKYGNGEDRKKALAAAGFDYDAVQAKVNELMGAAKTDAGGKTVEALAKEVMRGDWGNGQERIDKLTAAGYDYKAIQAKVNELMGAAKPAAPAAGGKTIEEVAKEVIQGKWGNGGDRKAALEKAGYDYNAVQAKVNELLK